MEDLETPQGDYERAEYLQALLIEHSTGGNADNAEYQYLRTYFLQQPCAAPLLPDFVRLKRDLDQFWQFIKSKFPKYAQRRVFLCDAFSPLLNELDAVRAQPIQPFVSEGLARFDESGVQSYWQKALARKRADLEGAITAARTLLEAVSKHILDEAGAVYDDRMDLPKLYRKTAEALNLAPNQHTEKVFREILGFVFKCCGGAWDFEKSSWRCPCQREACSEASSETRGAGGKPGRINRVVSRRDLGCTGGAFLIWPLKLFHQ